jgi:hypothetical protein
MADDELITDDENDAKDTKLLHICGGTEGMDTEFWSISSPD